MGSDYKALTKDPAGPGEICELRLDRWRID